MGQAFKRKHVRRMQLPQNWETAPTQNVYGDELQGVICMMERETFPSLGMAIPTGMVEKSLFPHCGGLRAYPHSSTFRNFSRPHPPTPELTGFMQKVASIPLDCWFQAQIAPVWAILWSELASLFR